MLWIVLVVLAVGSIGGYALRYGIGPVPTSGRVRTRLLEALPNLQANSVVYELGAGWGTLLFPLAARYSTSKVKAFEISPLPWLYCRLRLLISSQENVEIHRRDFFKSNLSDANLIVCYLYPGAMQRLSDQLRTELCPGATVVTHTFRLPNWQSQAVLQVSDLYHTSIYIYQQT